MYTYDLVLAWNVNENHSHLGCVQGYVGSSDVSFKQHSSNLGLTLNSTPEGIQDTLEGMQHTAQGIYKVMHKLYTGCG